MDKGTCWHCDHLVVVKDIDEIFWHYRCNKNNKELDPKTFVYYEPCFKKKSMRYEEDTDKVHKEYDDIGDEEVWTTDMLKPGNIARLIEKYAPVKDD